VKNIKLFAVFGIGSLATVHVTGRTSTSTDKERIKKKTETEVTILPVIAAGSMTAFYMVHFNPNFTHVV
jgi:hypothetical protein